MQSDGEYTIENYDGYSMAEGDKKGGFFSKERRDERKEKRAERRAARKGAKPLKVIIQDGVKKFKKILTPVKKNADGSGTKPDGTIIPASRMGTINAPKMLNVASLNFDKADVLDKTVEVLTESGKPEIAVTVPDNDTVTAVDEKGNTNVYKKSDTVPVPDGKTAAQAIAAATPVGGSEQSPMSATTKWLIGGAAVAVLAIIGVVIYKKRNK